jgi:hypothetical protein
LLTFAKKGFKNNISKGIYENEGCGSASLLCEIADPDPAFHFNADPDPHLAPDPDPAPHHGDGNL